MVWAAIERLLQSVVVFTPLDDIMLEKLFGAFWRGEKQPFYGFTDTRQPGPGTQEFAFRPTFFLPPSPLLGYGGITVRNNLREYQPPQIMHNLRVPDASATGGGIIAGSIYGQPLLGQDATGTNSGNATGS